MKESVLDEALFRHSFLVAVLLGTLCRLLVLRISDRQYPTRPQDYIEQIIMAGLTSALGGIALPALMDKEFSALTFLAVGIQQFQGLSKQEKITLNNVLGTAIFILFRNIAQKLILPRDAASVKFSHFHSVGKKVGG